MDKQQADKLIELYLAGAASPDERNIVESWYYAYSAKSSLTDEDDFEHLYSELYAGTLKRANLQYVQTPTRLWSKFAVAASILLVLCSGIYYLLENRQIPIAVTRVPLPKNDRLPGGNRAVLILSSGKQINLNGVKNGELTKVSNTIIAKSADGHIIYQPGQAENLKETYNIMITPKGGQYSVTLSDGTIVTLNAASSLKFPTVFIGQSRTVELSGEAYFEVAHNIAKPFRVINKGQVIEVLGTHFNVDGYDDDDLAKTTLLEGSIKIHSGNNTILLKPGQQSQFNSVRNGSLNVVKTDVDQVIAWKNGFFVFNDIDIKEVMKVVSRWYDVDVEYHGDVAGKKIGGTISRYKNISELLDNIREVGKINYKIEGRRVIIMD